MSSARPGDIWYRKERRTWCADVFNPQTRKRQRWNLGSDERDARREYHLRMAGLYGPQAVPQAPGGLTLAALAEKYIDWCFTNKARVTAKYRQCYMRWFLDASCGRGLLAAVLAGEVRPADIEAVKAAHRASHSVRAVNAAVSTIKAVYSWGMRQELLSRNPLAGVQQLPKGAPKKLALDPAALAAALVLCDTSPPLGDFLRVLLHTGMRPGELSGLPWGAYDQAAGIISVERHKLASRTGAAKHIVVSSAAADIINRQPAGAPDAPIFGMSAQAARQRLARLRATHQDMPRISLHAMRHTAATQMLAAGESLYTVGAVLGHHSSLMTIYYAKAQTDQLRRAVERING